MHTLEHTHTNECMHTHKHTHTHTCKHHKYVHTQLNSRTYEPAHLHTHERTHAHTTLMCGMRNEGVKEEQPSAKTRARAHTATKLQPRNVAKTQESEGDMKLAGAYRNGAFTLPWPHLHANNTETESGQSTTAIEGRQHQLDLHFWIDFDVVH